MAVYSLYIHIPYCAKKCPYCDFNTYALATIPEDDYVTALLSEFDARISESQWQGRSIQTIYFGGGTPSLFQPESILKIIAFICKRVPVEEMVEISLEANPGGLTQAKLYGFREAGVNRLSLGAQSFNHRTLTALGRTHVPTDIESAVESARSAGFTNLSLDLIYGVPGQTLLELKDDLKQLVRLDPAHISSYGLTIEKGTPFYQRYRKKQLQLPREDVVFEMMETLNSFLPSCGYHRYEVSNFAKEGRAARHNMAYWDGDDYLGLGAGAHSFYRLRNGSAKKSGVRWANAALPNKYIKQATTRGFAEAWKDVLSVDDMVFEFFFLGLRKSKGVSCADYKERFGVELLQTYPTLVQVLTEERLLRYEDDMLRLTQRGFMVADSVIENFAEPELPLQSKHNPSVAYDVEKINTAVAPAPKNQSRVSSRV